jgi:hypothetical protein
MIFVFFRILQIARSSQKGVVNQAKAYIIQSINVAYIIQSVNISSLDICDKDQEKRDDARLILRMNIMVLDWFSPSHRVIALRLIFVILCYEI